MKIEISDELAMHMVLAIRERAELLAMHEGQDGDGDDWKTCWELSELMREHLWGADKEEWARVQSLKTLPDSLASKVLVKARAEA